MNRDEKLAKAHQLLYDINQRDHLVDKYIFQANEFLATAKKLNEKNKADLATINELVPDDEKLA